MATVADLSGNRPNNAPVTDEHIIDEQEEQTNLLTEIEVNTTPTP